MSHTIDLRVYYEDTDAGGVMYHGTHLNYAERGRTEFLRHIGYQNSDLAKDFGMIFLVRRIDVEYFKPGFLDDSLSLETSITAMKNTSFTMRQILRRGGEVLAEMNVVLVCVDVQAKKPVKIPQGMKDAFEKHMAG